MTFEWYRLFNLDEWEATGLVARTLQFELENRGPVTVEVFRGALTSLVYDGVMLPVGGIDGEQDLYVGIGGQYASYVDEANEVYLGFRSEEDAA